EDFLLTFRGGDETLVFVDFEVACRQPANRIFAILDREEHPHVIGLFFCRIDASDFERTPAGELSESEHRPQCPGEPSFQRTHECRPSAFLSLRFRRLAECGGCRRRHAASERRAYPAWLLPV